MKSKRDTHFWPAYSDLMTSLFFIMLVLYVLTVALLKKQQSNLESEKQKSEIQADSIKVQKERLEVKIEQHEKIMEIESALAKLDPQYFKFIEKCKRHELNIDIVFDFNEFDLTDRKYRKYHKQLIEAGKYLANMINSINVNDGIKFLLVIEGRAGMYNSQKENERLKGQVKYLSYARAKSLSDFWESNGIVFNKEICEVIIAGSGFSGHCRQDAEINNRRFIIQILPKVGDM